MRTYHRVLAVFAVVFGLWFACTGLLIQGFDLSALYRGAPATDPTMQGMRVGAYGPPNFQVIRVPDFTAPALPPGLDLRRALATVTRGARGALGTAPIAYLDLRMRHGPTMGQVASRGQVHTFDAATGARQGAPEAATLAPLGQPSWRNWVKDIHRFRLPNEWLIVVTVLASLLLGAMLVTGATLYVQLLRQRRRLKRRALFWKAGGWWRTLHRATAVVATLFLAVVVLSGLLLSTSSLWVSISKAAHGGRPGLTADVSTPLADAALGPMLDATLAAYARAAPGVPLRVVRLRYFAGMPQGIVVTGDPMPRQLAFDTRSGAAIGLSGPNYPRTDMLYGWQIGQWAKQVHRGDIIGLPGRWMDVLTGLALLYLSISGAAIYWELYRKRRQRGKLSLFWS